MYFSYQAPWGMMYIELNKDGIISIDFKCEKQERGASDSGEAQLATWVIQELDGYFAGTLKEFTVPIQPQGTAFFKEVWQELIRIPYGETDTYGNIARILCPPPQGARAVGMANNRNPIPIVIPCHRVIGKDGTIKGYDGGVEIKQFLLDLEKRYKE